MQFLEDLHQSGWVVVTGPRCVAAIHSTWGTCLGRGEKLPEMLDDLRAFLRKRELCE